MSLNNGYNRGCWCRHVIANMWSIGIANGIYIFCYLDYFSKHKDLHMQVVMVDLNNNRVSCYKCNHYLIFLL
jgi:hypothetical protein